ncbi:MAG: AbrB/MazE/SpoVT family DNA-binding domain-containing protein [Sulfolobales archaeon]|nr:AbrB/MazE/SpoVT family DNA-binding domain-containing protein [Sulfolobales archaeon]MCX8198640.1 AbrB/MazE/SpoVT family DNA-binding domain-containing protein [Sulfolobales archaeon]MDW8169714.1 AbrB/MazE/SpoVT family DNA-binding domain-containing protein [Desulfurococcaceae archaeon]
MRKAICNALGMEEDDELALEIRDGILLRPIKRGLTSMS